MEMKFRPSASRGARPGCDQDMSERTCRWSGAAESVRLTTLLRTKGPA